MSDHYVALNDGIEGFKYSDFITGTVNTVGVNQFELRIQDGTALTRKDIHDVKGPRALLRKCATVRSGRLPDIGLELSEARSEDNCGV
jgi:hypothetical protein